MIVNGPARARLGLNSTGNVFGSGFRANATIGRAIRLGAINAFGLRPHELDQATQGTPAKYSACIAENEEESPWPAGRPRLAGARGGGQGRGVQPDPVAAAGRSPGRAARLRCF